MKEKLKKKKQMRKSDQTMCMGTNIRIQCVIFVAKAHVRHMIFEPEINIVQCTYLLQKDTSL